MEKPKPEEIESSTGWETWIANPEYNLNTQLLMGFCIGLIFSPWSYGWLFFVIFLIVWELLYGIATKWHPSRWNLYERLLVLAVSLLGWVIGRMLVGYNQPFENRRKHLIKDSWFL